MPADARLGEGDDAVGARLGEELRTHEQRLHAVGRVLRCRKQLDAHAPAFVVAARHELGLLEHPDEHAWIALGRGGRELVRVDAAPRLAQRAVHRPQLRGRRHVRDGEPAKRRGVARAREQERVARHAVPPRAPDHLDVLLERAGVVDEADEAHVGLVDPHPESSRRDDDLRAARDEVVLDARALLRLEPRVVVLRPEAVSAQDACELLRRAARARVDDGRCAAEPAQAVDEDAHAVLGVRDLLDVVAEVRPDDAGRDHLRLAAERAADLLGGLGRRGGRHPEQHGLAELRERPADEEVVGAEVVPPHAHAVHLVDDDEADADRAQHRCEPGLAQTLRSGVNEPFFSRAHLLQPSFGLFGRERGVHERRRRSDLRRQLVDLVLHQRDQGREDERRLLAQHRRELVGQRLPRARRHQRERVAAVDCGAHDLLLPWPEGVEAEELAERCREVLQAREYKSARRTSRRSARSCYRSGFLRRASLRRACGCAWK